MKSEHVFVFANGDKVRVKAEPTVSNLNGKAWPAHFEGYIVGHNWSDRDEMNGAYYWFYVEREHPAWGMQFAEADLELIEKRA
jgi:hypothetical protein